jgi:hypothetical protein
MDRLGREDDREKFWKLLWRPRHAYRLRGRGLSSSLRCRRRGGRRRPPFVFGQRRNGKWWWVALFLGLGLDLGCYVGCCGPPGELLSLSLFSLFLLLFTDLNLLFEFKFEFYFVLQVLKYLSIKIT